MGPHAQVDLDSDWVSDLLGAVLGCLIETLTTPQLVHQVVAQFHVLQIGPRQVYPGPRLVYPRQHIPCAVLPATDKCQIR